MTDSCPCKYCDYKIEALDERIDDRFIATYKEMDLRLTALTSEVHRSFSTAKEAVTKAEITQDRRLEGMNEFRAQLNQQATTFVTRDVVATITDRINKLERMDSDTIGRRTGYQPLVSIGLLVLSAVVGAIIAFVFGQILPK